MFRYWASILLLASIATVIKGQIGVGCYYSWVLTRHTWIEVQNCTVGICNPTKKECECKFSSVPDKNGTGCNCVGHTYAGPDGNSCIKYTNAVAENNVYKCSADTTVITETHTCDCPVKGQIHDGTKCGCGISAQLDVTLKECVCVGASWRAVEGDSCVRCKNSELALHPDVKPYIFKCERNRKENPTTKSCE